MDAPQHQGRLQEELASTLRSLGKQFYHKFETVDIDLASASRIPHGSPIYNLFTDASDIQELSPS